MGIVRREGKTTQKALEAGDWSLMVNLAGTGLEDLDKVFELIMKGWSGASEIIAGEGKPNVIVREYESSPGAWLYDDTDTGISFLVWSDGWKKNAWKGSQIEYQLNKADLQQLPDAFGRLVKHLALSSGYYGMRRASQLKAFAEQNLSASEALALPLEPLHSKNLRP